MKKKTIIFISKFIPVNSHTGAMQRNIEWLKFLQKRYRVILIGLTRPEKIYEEQNMRVINKCKEVIKEKISFLDLIFTIPARLIWYEPLQVNKFYSSKIQKRINKLLRKEKVSFIFCSELSTVKYALSVKNKKPVYFDDHNVEYLLSERMAQIARGVKKIIYNLETGPIRDFELKTLRIAKHSYAVSEIDKSALIRLSGIANITTVRNSFYHENLLKHNVILKRKPTIVFVGNLDWLPNKQGLIHFLDNIWPNIIQRIPNAMINIIGSGSTKDFKAFLKKQNIVFHPNAPEHIKNSIINRSWLGIVPMYAGSGTRIKIIEYWAHKKPVVSTKIGAEGIGKTIGTIIKDKDQDFANAVIEMLSDRGQYSKKLGSLNFKIYLEKYKSERIYEDSLYNTFTTK